MDVGAFEAALARSFVDVDNGVLASEALERNARIQELSFYCKRLSTPQIGFVLNLATEHLEAGEVFLNLGVWEGYSFLAAAVDNDAHLVVGVDNFSEMNATLLTAANTHPRRYGNTRELFHVAYEAFGEGQTRFFEEDWREFLMNYEAMVPDTSIGAVFYDADHTPSAHREFFALVEPLLSRRCAICVDDLRYGFVEAESDRFLADHIEFRKSLDVHVSAPRHPAWWGGFQVLVRDAPLSTE